MQLHIAVPGDASYGEVSEFAREIYARRLAVSIRPHPQAFAFAKQERIIGCLGLYTATNADVLQIEKYVPDAFERIARLYPARTACAELGTRAIVPCAGFSSRDVSLGLIASLIVHAWRLVVRYFAFTSNRTALLITQALQIDTNELGRPVPERLDPKFREAWGSFFRVPQICFGFSIDSVQSLEGCHTALARLRSKGLL